jgi:hypothetical protein
MADDQIIDIKTRRKETRNPSHWAMVEQLIAAEGVIEVTRIMADICSDVPGVNPFPNVPPNPEVNERVWEILREAAGRLEALEDAELQESNE